ncbi:MAG: patatin-like phospholipase family protein [Alphaproteobacteria bacterium]
MTAARDHHLFSPGPKRILALDGGGVRGIVSVAFLERIEAILRERTGDSDYRLSSYFDLIGGTSTGAIIATALALGRSVAEVRSLYLDLAPKLFKRWRWRLFGLQSKFDHRPLVEIMRAEIGDRTLGAPDLLTGLAIVAKRFDTASTWVLTNNPRAKYWSDPPDGRHVGNHAYRLADVVRASTAAPLFFDPQEIAIAPGQPPGLFVDGAVSPHNNPALQLLMLAGIEAYGFGWRLGADDLLMISVGTGNYPERQARAWGRRTPAAALAVKALSGMIANAGDLVLTMMQWMSTPARRWHIDGEIGDLGTSSVLGGRPLLTFQRYDMPLDPDWIATETGAPVDPRAIGRLRHIDDPRSIAPLHALAGRIAARQVSPDHLPASFDPPRPAPTASAPA